MLQVPRFLSLGQSDSLRPWQRATWPEVRKNRSANSDAVCNRMEEGRAFVYVPPPLARGPNVAPAAILCFRPKAMSTSMYSALARGRNLSSKFVAHPHYHPSPNDTSFASHEYLRSHLPSLLADRNVPRITVVRDPYARLVSAFNLLETVNFTHEKTFYWHVAPPGYYQRMGFESFVKRILPHKSGHLNMHIRLQSSLCRLPNSSKWDFILKLEQFDQWRAPLASILGLRPDSLGAIPNARTIYTGEAGLARAYAELSPKTLEKLTAWLRPDLEQLGYAAVTNASQLHGRRPLAKSRNFSYTQPQLTR